MPTQSPGAALFGGKRFWTFAIIIAVIFSVSSCLNEQNKKAAAEKEHNRALSLATESSAVTTCKDWFRQLYGEGDSSFMVKDVNIYGRRDFWIGMNITYQATSSATRRTFTTTDDCQAQWDYREDAWEIRAR